MAKKLTFSTFPSTSSLNNKTIPVVLLHGWGLNSGVWHPLIKLFTEKSDAAFQLITLDLPGYGDNASVEITPYDLTTICQHIDQTFTQPAIFLGWSLGGLIATQMAVEYPNKVLGLITVASSPFFVEQRSKDWPGIKPSVLEAFHSQLSKDTAKTISGFLKIQAMGSPHIRQDIKEITKLVMAHTLPSTRALSNSLHLLSECDLRNDVSTITQPFLRLYGQNDSLVPKIGIDKINLLAEKSEYHVFHRASHAPFISHLDDFYQVLSLWLISNFSVK